MQKVCTLWSWAPDKTRTIMAAEHELRDCCKKAVTSGIPGGYRLVSTYDLPDCKTILKFEILKFSDWGGGGVFWVTWNLDLGKKTKVFNFWGEGVFWITWNLNLGKKTKVFNFCGGVGVFWVTWNLDLGKKTKVFNLCVCVCGGYSGTP